MKRLTRMINRLHNLPQLKERRRQLRNALTPAESLLWKNLQRSQVSGRKFRRQHSVGPYIVDLERQGIRVLRFENRQVFESLEEVLTAIQVHLKDGSSSGSPPQ